ncbi:aminoglycoside phosphotransferase [Pseudonocardiaceae bacterium YIM PH 21723]|nr:aminoglycoside phosphotransferase [Pseudonocardiaceae bacterium YIM PH 21723]
MTVDHILDALPDWLPEQRWFGGKGAPITKVRPLSSRELAAGLTHTVIAVHQEEQVEHYQLLIGHDETGWWDATTDGDLSSRLLELFGSTVDGVEFRALSELDTSLRARPLTVEQSNTSLVFGTEYILKLFRRLIVDPNQELELLTALASVNSQHIATPLGSIHGEVDGQPVTLGLLQGFLADSADGWAMATASVRDLLADPYLHADAAGGDFAGEAERLGQAVAAVHLDLELALGSEPATPDQVNSWIQRMHRRLDAVVTVVPELSEHEPELRAAYDAATDVLEGLTAQRIHGDLHLGQVLRTTGGWSLIDFEGEPAADRPELRESPLRDVAGLLRSFDYAAHHLLIGEPDNDQLRNRALEWARRNRTALCAGYAEVATDPRQHALLLRAFELDKAVYEVGYEHANRPEWLPVPLSSISAILGGEE